MTTRTLHLKTTDGRQASLPVEEVYYMEKDINIFSEGLLQNQGHIITEGRRSLRLKSGVEIPIVFSSDHLYYIEEVDSTMSDKIHTLYKTCYSTRLSQHNDDIWLHHLRFGHASEDVLHKIPLESLSGINKLRTFTLKGSHTPDCKCCRLAKSTRPRHKRSTTPLPKQRGECIHSDVWESLGSLDSLAKNNT